MSYRQASICRDFYVSAPFPFPFIWHCSRGSQWRFLSIQPHCTSCGCVWTVSCFGNDSVLLLEVFVCCVVVLMTVMWCCVVHPHLLGSGVRLGLHLSTVLADGVHLCSWFCTGMCGKLCVYVCRCDVMWWGVLLCVVSLVPSPLPRNVCCCSEDGLGNCGHFLGAVMSKDIQNHVMSLPSCKHRMELRYMGLDPVAFVMYRKSQIVGDDYL